MRECGDDFGVRFIFSPAWGVKVDDDVLGRYTICRYQKGDSRRGF